MVKRGKLAARLLVPIGELEAATRAVRDEGLHYAVEEADCGWHGLWIWDKPLAGELIDALPLVSAHLPARVYCWYIGSLFGYSVEAIEAHLRELGDENPGAFKWWSGLITT
jgi:hypothetical protein